MQTHAYKVFIAICLFTATALLLLVRTPPNSSLNSEQLRQLRAQSNELTSSSNQTTSLLNQAKSSITSSQQGEQQSQSNTTAPSGSINTPGNTDAHNTNAPGTTELHQRLWVDPASSGEPWGHTVKGLLTFRGNPTRTYYGSGPLPDDPHIVWRFPEDTPLCSTSSAPDRDTSLWCGSGWTGQPAIFEHNERTWLVMGTFSGNVHFLDAHTGKRILPDFETSDIIKGSVTVDPDGYPLVYVGSRDNFYRVISFDTETPKELWSLNAYDVAPVKWNNDWDGAGLVLNDYLIVGGENSHIHIVKLNRSYLADGSVTVDPELVFNAPGWDDELIAAVGNNVSIENSVAVSGNIMYFANSGGLVQGWDIGGLDEGETPERVFRFWTGDDTDASLVIDEAGMLYVAVEYERGNARSHEVGQIMKLNPSSETPLVWSVEAQDGLGSGVWATPGLYRDLLIVPTSSGEALGIDTATGDVLWTVDLAASSWSSPVIVDDVWIQADCGGRLSAFDLNSHTSTSRHATTRNEHTTTSMSQSDTDTNQPVELWRINLGGCIESTPAVWNGIVVVGTKQGWIYGIR